MNNNISKLFSPLSHIDKNIKMKWLKMDADRYNVNTLKIWEYSFESKNLY